MMTLTVGVDVVEAAAIDSEMTEVIDASTDGAGEYTVVVRVLTQGRFPTMLCPYWEKPMGLYSRLVKDSALWQQRMGLTSIRDLNRPYRCRIY